MTETMERQTVADRIKHLRVFSGLTRARGNVEDADKVDDIVAYLAENFSPDMRLLTIPEALAWDWINDEQKFVIRWQHYRHLELGSFWTALMEAINNADEENMARLTLAYPEVAGVTKWRKDPEFAKALRRMPFEFSL